MKIYLAMSKDDFGSDYAEAMKAELMGLYYEGDMLPEIIDPSDYQDVCLDESIHKNFMDNMLNIFYPLIRECDLFVYLPRYIDGELSSGVRLEIKYAEFCGKDVENGTDWLNKGWE